MAPGDQCVGGDGQLQAGRRLQQGTIVADAQHHIGARGASSAK